MKGLNYYLSKNQIKYHYGLEYDELEFDELTSDIYNNQNSKDLKITVNKKTYDLKNAKIFWIKVTKSKISRNEAKNCIKN